MLGRPKLNTIQRRRHRGAMLFCTKKLASKNEEHSTETTHHQRAHVKLNRFDMFSEQSLLKRFSLEISMDDKAYIRPGTDVGFKDIKAGVILQLTNEEQQRKLPQHDFVLAKV